MSYLIDWPQVTVNCKSANLKCMREPMYGSDLSNVVFHVHSPIEAEVLRPLVDCQQEELFAAQADIAPIGLNLYFPANPGSGYAELIKRELGLYAARLQQRTLTKTWFRGSPLTALKAGELTELAFHTNLLFSHDTSDDRECGFECAIGDVTPQSLALMKGLRFDHILLCLETMIPPNKQGVAERLPLIDEYQLQNQRYRLDVKHTDPDTLDCWLEVLLEHHPEMLEIQGLEKMDDPLPLASLVRQFKSHQYQLVGDRFFVPDRHALLQLRQRQNLRYMPWGLCQRQLSDWPGVGVGALGKLGSGYYQNTESIDRYRDALYHDQLPVCCSGTYPKEGKIIPFHDLVDQLLCQHRIVVSEGSKDSQQSQGANGRISRLRAAGWMEPSEDGLLITERGLNHLPELCQVLQQG